MIKEIFKSKEFKYIALFGLVLILIALGLHVTGKTVLDVDQIYCRGYYPWKAVHPEINCSPERDGDHIFESTFIATELDYLSKNLYQNSYSERIMNGYPVPAAYTGNPYTLTRLLDKVMPVTSSTNFVALFYLFASFVVGYCIAKTLEFDAFFATVFGFLSITCSYVFLIEAYNMSLLGFGLVTLGTIQFYVKNRRILFVFLTLVGALCIMLSAFFQLYIYTALCILLAGILFCFAKNKRKNFILIFSIGAIFVASALLLNSSLLSHVSFLKSSTKIHNQVAFSEFIKHKDYAFDPVGWIGYEPVQINRKIMATLFGEKFGYYTYGSVTYGNWSPGPVFMVLFFIGIVFLWKKGREYRGYVIFSLFWLLYSAGYIQLLLSLVIGSPFKEETSLRASNLFFLMGTFAVVFALRGLLQHTIILSKIWKRILGIFFIYLSIALPVLIVVRYKGYKQLLLESIFITISSLLFLIWMYFWKNEVTGRKKYLLISLIVISLILPSFGRLFLGANPVTFSIQDSSLYYPENQFGKALTSYQEKNQKINRVALLQTKESGRIQHQNGPIFLGLSTITGYRNPIYRDYADLFYYHKFIFEGSSNTQQDFENLQKSVAYLNNDLGSLVATTSKIKLGEATLRYFTLTGVDALLGPENIQIENSDWKKIVVEDNLSLWQRKTISPEFFFVQHEVVIPNRIDRLEYILNNPAWNPQTSAVTNSKVLTENSAHKNSEKIILIKKTDGYRLFKTEKINPPGILALPVTFDKHWKANFKSGSEIKSLYTFEVNSAFLGVLVPEGSGNLEMKFDDSNHGVNYLLSCVGILTILSLLFLLKRFSPWELE